MRLTMHERRTVTKAMARQYRRGSKKAKGELLTQFVEATGYHRVYAARLLRTHGTQVVMKPGIVVEARARASRKPVGRDKHYDGAVVEVLETLWCVGDHICGKRLVVFIRETLPCPRKPRCGYSRPSGRCATAFPSPCSGWIRTTARSSSLTTW